MKRRVKRSDYIYLAICAAVILLTAVLCCLIRPAADDFYYATFCDEGLPDLIRNTWYHYRNITGRVFVHLILCPLLQLDMWPFRIFNLLLICLLALLCAKVCGEKRGHMLPVFAASLCMFWLMGIETLSDAVLWGAGSLNYLFPTALVLLYCCLFRRYSGRTGGAWLFIMAFLCSATVEMTGILTVITIPYICFADRSILKRRPKFVILNFAAALAGFLSLFTSSGVKTRLENGAYTSVSLLQRMNANFALFDRKVCGPEGIWAVVMLALLSAALLLFFRKKRIAGGLVLLSALSVGLAGLGIVYDGVALAAIAIFAFLALCSYAVWTYTTGERVIPFCMLCTAASLAVCVISPVVGPRMVFPSAVFLMLLCIRSVLRCEMPGRWIAAIVSALALSAVVLLCVYVTNFSANAKVIDQNDLLADACSGEGTLQLSYVPDEIFGGTTVPSPANFGRYFLLYKGLPDVKIECTDPTAVPIGYDGQALGYMAILRGGQYYVPVRIASAVLGADVSWELASATVAVGDGVYCFHAGNHAADLGHGICRSIKLMDPVRMVDSVTYISQRDFEALFDVELTLPYA